MAAESRRYEGRSAAEAAIKACEELGVTRSEVRYEVVSDEGEGLDRRVVITATVDEQASQSRPRGRAGGREGEPARERDRGERRRDSRSRDDADSRRGRGRRGMGGPSRGSRPPRRGGAVAERGGGGRGRSRGPRPQSEPADNVESMLELQPVPTEREESRPEIDGELSAKASRAREVVIELLRLMEFDLTPRVVEDGEDEIHVDLVGPDEAAVIGRTGDVLLSLQFLANRIVARDTEGAQVVVLDAAGYRRRRRLALEELARRLAERAMEEGRAIRLSPMSAHDRRVFHLTLNDVDGVSTRSQGDGLYRKMLIIPSEAFS